VENPVIVETLKKEIDKSLKKNEVPIAAIVVKGDRIISSAHNQTESKGDVTAHAEVLAIKKAAKKLKTWKLNDCELYVTLEPCIMCAEVIRSSRIKRVHYFVPSDKKEKFSTDFVKVESSEQNENFLFVIKAFFEDMRQK